MVCVHPASLSSDSASVAVRKTKKRFRQGFRARPLHVHAWIEGDAVIDHERVAKHAMEVCDSSMTFANGREWIDRSACTRTRAVSIAIVALQALHACMRFHETAETRVAHSHVHGYRRTSRASRPTLPEELRCRRLARPWLHPIGRPTRTRCVSSGAVLCRCRASQNHAADFLVLSVGCNASAAAPITWPHGGIRLQRK